MLPVNLCRIIGGSNYVYIGHYCFKLIKRFYNVIFPWSDYAFFSLGAYAKFIIILFMLQQCFNIIYAYMEKKGGGNK